MRRLIGLTLAGALISLGACSESKKEEKAEAVNPFPAAGEGDVVDTVGGDEEPAEVVDDRPLLEQYPPFLTYQSSVGLRPNNTLNLGFDADPNVNNDFIATFAISAIPVDPLTGQGPLFQTEAEFVAFMNAWATEFVANAELVAELDAARAGIAFTVDATYLTEQEQPLPATFFDGAAPFVQQTRRFFARRFRSVAPTIAATPTNIQVSAGAEALYSFPVTVAQYAESEAGAFVAARAFYDNPENCAACHSDPNNQLPFVGHSSDLLAFFTDLELTAVIEQALAPGSTVPFLATHTYLLDNEVGFGTADMIAILRSFPPAVDKIAALEEAAVAVQTFMKPMAK